MRVHVWIEPTAPLIASCMLRVDDGVMIWTKFRYKKVYKVCKRCGIIGHTTPHCPHSNLDIERMIGNQIELINMRFEVDIGYDLQHTLFTNKIKAFNSRSYRRTTEVEVIRRTQPEWVTIELQTAHQSPQTWLAPTEPIAKKKNDFLNESPTNETNIQPQISFTK